MAGIKALRKIQIGRETVAGTGVAATVIWRGLGTIEDQREQVRPDEDIGLVVPTDRSYTAKQLGELKMEATEMTFQQACHILEAAIKSIGTGVADGAGSGKIYDYTFPEASKNTIKTYTLEMGDDEQEEEMAYGFVTEFKISGKAGEAVMIEAIWQGRQVAPSTFTGSLSLATVEEILTSKGKLFIDTVAASYGTTEISNTLLAFELSVKTGWVPVFACDGELYFSFAKLTRPEIKLDVTFEHNASAVAQKAIWRAETARKLQLKFTGSALSSAGTTYTYYTMIINLAGKWEKFEALDDQDGNDVVKGTFVAGYNATAADVGDIIIVNETASLP
jgi:hypothetical protein